MNASAVRDLYALAQGGAKVALDGAAAMRIVEQITPDIILLDAVMPAAVFNYLLAERFKTAPEDVAGGVALSTLASVMVLPAVLAFVI